MVSVIHFCLGFIIVTASSLNYVDANYNKYVSLITAVRMQEYTMVHLLTRLFSSRGASTLISIFPSLNTRVNTYKKRMVPPLIVVMLASRADIVEFDRSVDAINKSYPIWLVIFRGSAGQSFCAYCNNPVGNMFSLRFDTLMFVVCCDSPIVQQWWAVHENQTESHDFGSWRANEGFKLLELKQLKAMRHDVYGTELRLVVIRGCNKNLRASASERITVQHIQQMPRKLLLNLSKANVAVRDVKRWFEGSPLIRNSSDNRIGGFLGVVLSELKNAMNFTIKSMRRLEVYGNYNSTSKRWTGAIGLLARNEADIGLADFTVTDARLDVVDFSLPMLVSSFQLFIKKPDNLDVQWSAYFKVFTLEIWLTIIILVMTSPFLLAIIKVKELSGSLLSVTFEKCLNVWGIFCQQGLLEFPAEPPLKMAYFSIFVSALIVSAAYSASLISFLTLSSTTLPFTSVEGFIADKSYKLVVSQQSADYDFFSNSNAPIAVRMMELMKPLEDLPKSSTQAWSQVCEEKVALYASMLIKSMTPDIPCEVVGIHTGRVESVAIALPANSQYTDVINYHIGRFTSNGMFKRLQQEYSVRNMVDLTITTYSSVEFSGVVPILSVLAGGIISACVALICEITYYTVKNHKRCCQRKMQRGFISRETQNSEHRKKCDNRFFD